MVIPLLAIICSISFPLSRALIITLPSKTITTGALTLTYQSEAADAKGNLSFYIGHIGGVGGYFLLNQDVVPATTPTKLQLNLFDKIGDGQQWEISAGLATEGLSGLFAVSDPVVVLSALSVSASASSASASAASASASVASVASVSAASVSVSRASALSAATSNNTPTGTSIPNKTSQSTSTTKSSPSVGLIVGITLGIVAILIILVLFAFLYFRKQRRRRRALDSHSHIDIDPAFVPHSAFVTSHAGSSYGADSLAPKIEPFMPAPSTRVSRSETLTTTTTGSSKAAQARQEYLRNQMREVQWQLQAQGATSPSVTSRSEAPSGSEDDSVGLAQARLQNEALQQRIQALEEQLQSRWALGLSDEPPPGYLE
ncbi:hypothetical protein DFH08DRAFT_80437 [Mycena albidolilacea]|uniref:Mid2 domain-containing protein n=1 Tax=Mycena albidolilacea TaxID=1033008 RepID=A0AAD7EWN5_9AGAR|nr:hypothetical protein DFH08DRAFT_80437 [Mycena albidolilacea]